jgi:hypothetical protein
MIRTLLHSTTSLRACIPIFGNLITLLPALSMTLHTQRGTVITRTFYMHARWGDLIPTVLLACFYP